jgi:N-ethylmaleimide reductase
MGRVSHPDFLGGATPVAPSPIQAQGETHTAGGKKPYVTPRALDLAEIPRIVQEYAAATARASAAGFDGVELHAANGYLIDQFLRDRTNQRTDRYGGSVANRARFLLEVAEACAGAWSADRVGVRLSPSGAYNDMADSNPVRTFEHAARSLGRLGLAYLHVTEPGKGHPMHVDLPPQAGPMRAAFDGPFVLNHGGDAAAGERALAEGHADLIAFGLAFLANPDFVRRTRRGEALNQPDWATLYTPGEKGYNDYPTLA